MPSLRNRLALAAAAITGVAAVQMKPDQICLQSIYEANNYLVFAGDDPVAIYMNACQNPLKVCSMYATGRTYCSEDEVESGAKYINETCLTYALAPILPIEQCTGEYDVGDAALNGLTRVEMGSLDVHEDLVVLSPTYFGLTHRTLDTFQYELRTHKKYGFVMYGFWAIVLFGGILRNLYNTFWHARADRQKQAHHEGESAPLDISVLSNTWRLFRQHVTLPPVLGDRHRRLLFGFFVPTRIEGFIVYSFWIVSLVLCAVTYNTFEGNMYWPTIPPQVWRYLGDRTGILAYANLPILWLFSGRNNIFLWATGWDFGTFNLFHRHVARVATIEAIVHSAAWTVLAMPNGLYDSYLPQPWFYLGILAMVTMGMLLVLSSVWLRRRFYDLFLLIHIAFSILTIVSLFYHTSVFVDRQYDGYLWPVVAIWVFDRFLRLVRLTYCNLRVASGGKFISTTKATATYSEAANVVKLVVSPAHSLLRPRPGQYYFVYRPLRWKGWESHPFTVGSWRDESDYVRNDVYSSSASSSGDARPRSINDDKEKEGSVVNASHDSSRSNSVSKPLAASGQELIFWLRPRDGFTRELRDHCRKFDNFTSTSSILIEGPYGHHAKLHNYETVLLIAGGTGMSGIVCYIQEHIRRVKAGKPVRTQNIQVIFSCKQEAFIREVCAAELREAVSRDDIDFQFFSTGTQMSISSAAGSKTEAPNRGVNVEVVVSHGRPDLGAAVSSAAQAIAEGGARAGRLAVLVCGPASMADQARKSVRRAMKEGRRNIEYIEETFGW